MREEFKRMSTVLGTASLPNFSNSVITKYIEGEFSTLSDCIDFRKKCDDKAFSWLDRDGNEVDSLSHADLYQKVTAVAGKLSEVTRVGEPVLLLFNPGLEFIVTMLGCLYAGVPAVPLNIPSKRGIERFLNVAADCSASLILSTPAIQRRLEKRITECIEELTTQENTTCTDLKWYCPDLANLELATQGTPLTRSPATPEQLAILQYTSGSTGKPKGVRITHRNMLHNCAMITAAMEFGKGVRQLSWLPLFHDMGLFGCVMAPVFSGAHTYHMSPADFLARPQLWLEAVSRYKIHITGGPNFAYDLCLEKDTNAPFPADLDLSSLKVMFNGAEPIIASTMEAFAARFAQLGLKPSALMPCYGMAETTLMATCNPLGQGTKLLAVDKAELAQGRVILNDTPDQSMKLVSSGVLAVTQQIRIVEPETLAACEEGQIGEIWINGANVSQGYFSGDDTDNPAFVEHAFSHIPQTWVRTGDLGFFWRQHLFVSGRRKDVIIIRGRNYYPQDIERLVEDSHPDFQRNGCAAFTLEEDGKLVVVAEVERRCKLSEPERMLQAAAAKVAAELGLTLDQLRLIRYGQLKKTSSGKVQRRGNRIAYLEADHQILFDSDTLSSKEPPQPDESVPLSGSAMIDSPYLPILTTLLAPYSQHPITALWELPFASLGIDSVKAVHLVQSLEQQTGLTLPVTLLWDYSTPAELIEYLDQQDTQPKSSPAAREVQDAAIAPHPDSQRVAVIGVGLRLPGADDLDTFWAKLIDAQSLIAEHTAPDGTRHHYAAVTNPFDVDFAAFGLTPKEAETMDPQQRWVLHTALHAMEHAGLTPAQLKGSDTGVYIGCSSNDYGRLLFEKGRQGVEAALGDYGHTVSGNAASICANRLSYLFDLRAQSVAVDTACSSSLMAVHQACDALIRGETGMAFAGGVHHICDSALSHNLNKAGMLSPRHKCEPFSSQADGYARGEGCVVLLLKRLDLARRDGDPIHGILAGWASNQDGLSNGLTAPSSRAQVQLYQQALQHSGTNSKDIAYIEAHGTGTPLGDPIELGSLSQVYNSEHPGQPTFIGSAKACFGHLEAAAGIVGLLKALEVVRRKQIPAQPAFAELNPHLNVGQGLAIARQASVFPSGRSAAISSFGFGGTNVHFIVNAETTQRSQSQPDAGVQAWPIALSADSHEALGQLVARWQQMLAQGEFSDAVMADISWTLMTGRQNRRWCLTTKVQDQAALSGWLALQGTQSAIWSQKPASIMANPVFLYPGQGSQRAGMALAYYQRFPVFKAGVEEALGCLENAEFATRIRACLLDDNETCIHNTRYSQVALFCYQYGLTQLLASLGITPEAVCGHSVGEIMAAHISGVFSLQDAIKLVTRRGQIMADNAEQGAMLVVHCPLEQLLELPDGCSVAVENSSQQVVVVGGPAAIESCQQQLVEANVKSQLLQVSHGFHSELVAGCLTPFAEALAQAKIQFSAPRMSYFSSLTGELYQEVLDVGYWQQHMRQPVRFSSVCHSLSQQGYRHFVELGEGGILSSLLQQNLEQCREIRTMAIMRDDQDLLSLLLPLYELGYLVNWQGWYPLSGRRIHLPLTPFDEQTLLHPSLTIAAASAPQVNSQYSALSQPSGQGQLSTSHQSHSKELSVMDPATISSGLNNIVSLCQQQLTLIQQELNARLSAIPAQQPPVATESTMVATNEAAIPENRQALAPVCQQELADTVRQAVADVIGMPVHQLNTDKVLNSELGMDSLMLIALRDKLLVQCPVLKQLSASEQTAMLMEGQTVNTLVARLFALAQGETGAATIKTTSAAEPVLVPLVEPHVAPQTSVEVFEEVQDLHQRLVKFGDNNPYFRVHERTQGCMSQILGLQRVHFASYNYLGLAGLSTVNEAAISAIDEFGTSVSASRPISGERPVHQRLEQTLAEFLGCEDAIAMLGGHSTNETVIGHIVGDNDLIIYDALAHNSIIQGSLMSAAARRAFPHNDLAMLDRMLTELRGQYRRVLIVVEGVYSMDGDLVDLPTLIELKKRHGCLLMVDEAHSIGTMGATGRGIGEYYGVTRSDVDLWMGTLSKSFASCGGYIAGSEALVTYLKYTAPGFLFSVGMTPANAAAAEAAIAYLDRHPERVVQLRNNADLMRQLMRQAGIDVGASQETPIIPVIVGDSACCVSLAEQLFEAGVNVNPIVYPAVEESQARLRFFVTYDHSETVIRQTVDKVSTAMHKLGLLAQIKTA